MTLFMSACATSEHLTFSKDGFNVMVTAYKSPAGSAKSLLIIPPTGGTNLIDKSYARKFFAAGYDVYILNEWTGQFEESTDVELHQRLYTRAQKAVSLVLSQVQSPFIGLLGTSVGALHAMVSAGVQNKINAVFTIVGGAPIAEVIVTSDQKAMAELKKSRFARYGFKSESENQAAIDRVFPLDPMKLGDGYKSKHMGMVIATQDTTVPTKTQQQAVEFFKPGKVITYENSHFWGIVKPCLFDSGDILQFFEESAHAKKEKK